MEGNTAFALDLYGRLKSRPGNLFFSPYSISTALAMTAAGARGNTEKQMRAVLHLGETPREINSAFGDLQRQLNDAGKQAGLELSVANALWAQTGHPFLPAFLDLAKSEHLANLNQVDFRTASETARAEINRWVAERTKDKIQDILPPNSVGDLTRLVLANAIYFKGVWLTPFNKDITTTEPFYVSASREVQVPLMHRRDEVRYMENGEFQAVELPYKGNELAMVILLPRERYRCDQLENGLSANLLTRSLREMKNQKVEIHLPRFKLESRFNLAGILIEMGMSDAFNARADFSGMDGTNDLFISAVFHKAWGEVNEEGTEAAAATALTIMLGGYPRPRPVFRADHPFLFFIRDIRSGSILFMGRLADPRT